MSSEGQAIRERVSHIARGCRAESSHNPTVYEVAIEDNLRALEARLADLDEAVYYERKYRAKAEARLVEAERKRDEWKAAAMRSRPGLLRAALPSESDEDFLTHEHRNLEGTHGP